MVIIGLAAAIIVLMILLVLTLGGGGGEKKRAPVKKVNTIKPVPPPPPPEEIDIVAVRNDTVTTFVICPLCHQVIGNNNKTFCATCSVFVYNTHGFMVASRSDTWPQYIDIINFCVKNKGSNRVG